MVREKTWDPKVSLEVPDGCANILWMGTGKQNTKGAGMGWLVKGCKRDGEKMSSIK